MVHPLVLGLLSEILSQTIHSLFSMEDDNDPGAPQLRT